MAFYVVNITVIRDCHGDLAGDAFIDNCDICVEGNTGLEENYLDIGCGCSIPFLGPFYEDEDGDSYYIDSDTGEELDGQRIIMIHIHHALTTILIATIIVVEMQSLMIVISAAVGTRV